MNDKPRERSRPRRSRQGRFDKGLAIAPVIGLAVLWAVGGCGARAEGQQATMLVGMEGVAGPTIGLLVVLMIVNALFVAAESALDVLRPVHIRLMKDVSEQKAARLQDLIEDQEAYLARCSLGNQVVRLVIVFAALILAPGVLSLMQNRFGWAENYPNLLWSAALIMLPVGLVHVIIAELIPKSFAETRPMLVLPLLYRFIKLPAAFFALPAAFMTGAAQLITKRFGGKASFNVPNAAEEEIKTIVESAQETGEINSDERELLHSVFEFTDTVAREIMTPRVDLDAMPVTSDPSEVVKMIHDTGHSRIPLYEESDDQIVGIIHAKDLFLSMTNGGNPTLRTLTRPALFVPENKKLYELLKEMRLARSQLAIVQDEFGGTAGIVTIEDIVEELVGDIVDEYDVDVPDVQEYEGGWLVAGKANIDDVSHAISVELETEEFDTIGGYVFGLFGRQPKQDESIVANGMRFAIAETDGRRIVQLKVEPCEPDHEEMAIEG
ncbi:MAG: HlyC/CorC family transporter [Fimbriimonadaceae bacterium]|nr:HlyC/CorC family transporter [Fimbriimonadaceae bacterium]